MDNISEKKKRSLKDVSHLFLSSMDPVSAEPELEDERVIAESEKLDTKIIGVDAIGFYCYSLLFCTSLAQRCLSRDVKIKIITSDVQVPAWSSMQSRFGLPELDFADVQSGLNRFDLMNNVELITFPACDVDSFLSRDKKSFLSSPFFDSLSGNVLCFFDLPECNYRLREKMLSYLDTFLVLVSSRIEFLREAYKSIKVMRSFNPEAHIGTVVNETDNRMQRLLNDELSRISSRFLRKEIECFGFCECETLLNDELFSLAGAHFSDSLNLDAESLCSFDKEKNFCCIAGNVKTG